MVDTYRSIQVLGLTEALVRGWIKGMTVNHPSGKALNEPNANLRKGIGPPFSNEARNSETSRWKRPLQLDLMLGRIRGAILEFPKAMLFAIQDRGFASVFEQLCACVISIRTLDEVSLDCALRLFAHARTAQDLLRLEEDEIKELISPATFQRQKSQTLRKIARIAVEKWQGEIPCDYESLTSLPGVGPKCANLVLGIACGKPAIGVDVHVHRVTNRWGLIHASTPAKSLVQLERLLKGGISDGSQSLEPERWIELNELLVPFGKHICTGRLPKCSTCPVLEFCRQVGVTRHR